ncbi:hypothetical protein SARC_08235 [Sphaeroforma arctica JP610]|uniref:F-box domain-containing protein n=1 Tax=Sphaeroforma arctica JP610 TaxID=667725 RepID=A0A0L0FRZ8_9EUKA|nr:hypothetical protein SARC_08235 [Sphaeroforma arctica JP610]KNC79371.1 hypothetical protein SARC_08235 [Sphaeroforma arctica JP610]|eukprot:XP_014153273.1 hypothetical protein SARC_08235 [Sphaeroforma arctica JP610]
MSVNRPMGGPTIDICYSSTIPLSGVLLPTELVLKVLSELNLDTLLQCKLVSRAFYGVASDPTLCKRLHLLQRMYIRRKSNEQLFAFAARFPMLEEWDFRFHKSMDVNKDLVEGLCDILPGLKHIQIAPQLSCMSQRLYELVTFYYPNITELTIHATSTVYPSSASLSSLVSLNVMSRALPCISSPSLKRLQAGILESGAVQSLITGCPKLLDLRLHKQDLDEELLSVCLTRLQVNTVVHTRALVSCPSLRRFDAARIAEGVGSSTVTEVNTAIRDMRCDLLKQGFPQCRRLVNISDKVLRTARIPPGFRSDHLEVLLNIAELPQECFLPNLRVLEIAMPEDSTFCFRFPHLTRLTVGLFKDKRSLVKTVEGCPFLTQIRFLNKRGMPWRVGIAGSADDKWHELAQLGLRTDVEFKLG